MVKLVFVDIDDTFLTPEKTVTAENGRILDAAYERGVQFVPCTGRNLSGLPERLVSHPAVRYAVCSNGGLIVDVETGEFIHEVAMDKTLVHDLYDEVRDLELTFGIFSGGLIYANRERLALVDRLDVSEEMRVFLRVEHEVSDRPTEEIIDAVGPITKVTMLCASQDVRSVAMAAAGAFPDFTYASSLPVNVEVSDARATKGTGLVWLSDFLGVPVADTVAFGDNTNDLSMILAAGDGVAMGNAVPELKAVADHVCGSCSDSGVARYLEPLLLG